MVSAARARRPPTAIMVLIVVATLACRGEPPTDHSTRLARAAARGLPTDLRPELESARPHGIDCAARMQDARDPSVHLELASQSVRTETFTRRDTTFTERWAEGEYTVIPAGRYGIKPGETLRVDCSRGAAIVPPGA